jgi:hypothetical protein
MSHPHPLPAPANAIQNQGQINYSTLLQSSTSGQIVFRVWDSTSASPLRLVDGDIPRSGFSAPSRAFHSMSPVAYASATNGMESSHWASGSAMRQRLVQHVLGVVPSPAAKARSEESVFVSASRSLDWSIWEVARRLAAAARRGREGEGGGEEGTVHLSVIRLDPPGSTDAAAFGVGPEASEYAQGQAQPQTQKQTHKSEVWFQPRAVIQAAIEVDAAGMYQAERDDLYRVRSMVGASNEVLFFGRVFGTSVLADLVFTAEVSDAGRMGLTRLSACLCRSSFSSRCSTPSTMRRGGWRA